MTSPDKLRQLANESLLAHFADLCEGAVIVDAKANVVWMNDRYPERLGIANPVSTIGRPIEEVIPNSQMRQVVESGQAIMLDIMDFGDESFVVTRLPLRDAERKLADARRSKYTFASFIGINPACTELKQAARRAARTASSVLILGETGTGKELLAQAIHAASPRASRHFVAVNIAAVPEALLEAEFFGVAPGAFTGADRRGREGKFKLADGGTLFLDEIGDMSLALQAKLLRTLQEREFEAVGSNRLESVDVRIIAATSRDLEQMVAAGQFRADLYYRLNVISLKTPALRERPDDMALLADYLIEQIARQQGIPLHGISSPALNRLLRHDWPGNVRELANVLERAMLMTDDDVIEAADLDRVMPPPRATQVVVDNSVVGIAEVVARAERQAIVAALRDCHGNKVQAARQLGISRAALYEKIAALGVDANVA